MLELNSNTETQVLADTVYFTKDGQQMKYAKLNQQFGLFLRCFRVGELHITTTKQRKRAFT